MRVLSSVVAISATFLFSGSLIAGDVNSNVSTAAAKPPHETYRGYYVSLDAVADRKDLPDLMDGLHRQIDIAEGAGLSRRVLEFFQSFPIRVDEFACTSGMTTASSPDEMKPTMQAACYGRSVPESIRDKNLTALMWGDGDHDTRGELDRARRAQIARTGTVMLRPSTLLDRRERERPIILHELLHAYHDHVLPEGFDNPAIRSWFKQATDKKLYPAEAYLMTNDKEFFAVTASVFLSGRDGPLDRAKMKELHPDYYKYLVWLFGVDPDPAAPVRPMASAN
jgi:hypothetical protein